MDDTPKVRKQSLLNRTLNAADKASEVAKDLVDMAHETAKSVVEVAVEVASDTARSTLQFTADTAQTVAQLAGGGAKMTVQLASGTAKVATQIAQEAALQMAQTYFSKTTLTVSLPESQINKQLRKMTEGHPYLDYITVSCGSDRLTVALDGHYHRLECKVPHDEQFLLLRQVDTGLDVQLRAAPMLSNFALRRAAQAAAFVSKRLPDPITPASLLLNSVSGVSGEGPQLWRVALHKNIMLELLQNRSWMVDKLLTLADLSVIPGLSLLIDSEDMLLRLVNQFEIRSMRVMPNRLELLIGINT